MFARPQSMQRTGLLDGFAILPFDLPDDTLLDLAQLPCDVVLPVGWRFLLNDYDGLVYQRHQQIEVGF